MSKTLKTIVKEDALGAMARFDSMGREAFLAEFGYKPSHTYKIRFRRREYDSKAILGVAAGLDAADFSGGVSRLAPVCRRLGLALINKKTGEKLA